MKKTVFKACRLVILLVFITLSFFAANYRFNIVGNKINKSMHLSIDDTIEIFEDLTNNENNYNSIFENYTLGYLKELHDEYDLKVSMYCYFENDNFELSDCTTKFRKEFEDQSDWLKFNYHSFNATQNLNDIDIDTFVSQYDLFRNSLIKIVGNNSWDTFTRLNYFSGNSSCVAYLVENGTTGFYCADDDRVSYSLGQADIDFVNQSRLLTMGEGGAIYKKTDIRLDNFDNPFYQLYSFQWDDICIEVFTHEWLISTPKASSIWKLKEICEFSRYYGINFVY